MARSPLPADDRECLRAVAEGTYRGEYGSDQLERLEREGYLYLSPAGYGLTDRGRTEHAHIMSSGDGPEGLKDLFRI